jgi:hypothetical protein
MTILLFGLLMGILMSPTLSLADIVSGTIHYRNRQVMINLEGRFFYVRFDNLDIAKDVQRLQPGDYLSGEGRLIESRRTLMLEAINYVGLKKLIGAWQDSDSNIVYFHDYRNVEFRSQNKSTVRAKYTLLPYLDNEWLLFLKTPKGLLSGSLFFFKEDGSIARVDVYDSMTGELVTRTLLSALERICHANENSH